MNDANLDNGQLADVAVRSSGDRWTLIFSRDLRHPPTRVWAALTDPEQLARWAPFLANRDLTVTGDATLTMVDGAARQELAASVTVSEPPTLLEYTWGSDLLRWELLAIPLDIRVGTGTTAAPDAPSAGAQTSDGGRRSGHSTTPMRGPAPNHGAPPNSSATPTGSGTPNRSETSGTGTRLTLQHTVAGRDGIPKAAAGWHLCLLVAEYLLDGQPIDPIRGREALNHGWSELNEAYSTRLGIPATDLPDPKQQ